MTAVEANVRSYLDKMFTKEQICKEDSTILAFSYIMCLPADECRLLHLDLELNDELEHDYMEIVKYIKGIKEELKQ